jgi:hypothetical protein
MAKFTKRSVNPGSSGNPGSPAAPAIPANPEVRPSFAPARPAAPSKAAIAKRAYEIWVAKGRPVGKDLENWQQAERELTAALRK